MNGLKNAKLTVGRPARKKYLLIVFVVLSLVILLACVFRSWMRMTVAPRIVSIAYSPGVQKVAEDELNKLQDPFASLGYKDFEFKSVDSCFTTLANGLRTQVECGYFLRAYAEISANNESKATLNKNAENLQNLLQQNGWQGEYSDSGTTNSLKKLVTSLTAGTDYDPDASYQKKIGSVQCYFHSNTAFSSPQPPAISTRFDCSRTINIFGNPNHQ